MSRTQTRAAFTLLELLMSLGILAMLFALTMSAVGAARGSALRTQRIFWHHQRTLGETIPRQLPIKMLFIGNSYTGVNDLPGMLAALSEAAGQQPRLIVDRQLVGGAKLKDHWDSGEALEKIRSDEWDFVVLQEQSQTPLPQFGRDLFFYPYARRFEKEIRAQQAIPLFFMTWARPDTPAPQSAWTESYAAIAKQLSAECCPAGMAHEKTLQGLPQINLYADSGGHPTPEATYLAACAFFATIFDKSPDRLPSSITTDAASVSLAAADATAMQVYAWQSLQEVKKRVRPDWRY